MVVSLNITGVKKTGIMLATSLKRIKIGQKEGLRKAALFMQGKVKSSIAGREAEPTSVDTGRLLNSVEFNSSKENAVVFTLVPYAKFIEDGTTKFQGRHHFRNSSNRNKGEVHDIINREIKSI